MNGDCGFYFYQTDLKFSEVIWPIPKALQEKNGWNPDSGQRRAITDRFAWLTGDKVLSAYNQGDIQLHVDRMTAAPTHSRWGKLSKAGAMTHPSEPYGMPVATPETKRDPRTMNRDLSVL